MSSAEIGSELSFRAFATHVDDLDVAFQATSRPQVVTDVLRACATDGKGEVPAPGALRQLDVGSRVDGLLRIVREGGLEVLTVELSCASPSCDQRVEVECSIEGLCELNRAAREANRCVVTVGDHKLELRRPTSADLEEWSSAEATEAPAIWDTIVSTLTVGGTAALEVGPLTEAMRGAIDEAMQGFDPLLSLRIEVQCPACGATEFHEVDLQEEVLAFLASVQTALTRDVHRLARDYHWSERDILSMPSSRRARYLTLIDEDHEA